MDKPRVSLCIPSGKYMDVFTYSNHLQFMLADKDPERDYIKRVHNVAGLYVASARNEFLDMVIKDYDDGVSTHAFFLDDDMIIPHDTITRLAAHNFPVSAGLYFTRSKSQPLVYVLKEDGVTWASPETIPDTGLLRVDGTGFGCILIHIIVLKELKAKFGNDPNFQTPTEISENGPSLVGEDLFFFRRLKQLGIPVYVDLAVKCGHMTTNIITEHTHKLSLTNKKL